MSEPRGIRGRVVLRPKKRDDMMEKAGDMRIDERVRALAEAVADLPGICILSSCGGHPDPSHRGHCPPDEFYVDFNVDVLAGGWHGLNILAFATSRTKALENLSITAWPNTDEPTDCVSFKLCGIEDADPDELADAIQQVLADGYGSRDEPSRQQGG